jgi:hypothetical protein
MDFCAFSGALGLIMPIFWAYFKYFWVKVFQKIMNMMKPYPKLIFKTTKHQNGVILMLYFFYIKYIFILLYRRVGG